MNPPLVTLSRPWGQVLLSDAFAFASVDEGRPEGPLELHAALDAAAYLRAWRHDRSAMASLRFALASRRQHRVSRLSDDEVIVALARLVAGGELVVSERRRAQTIPIWYGDAEADLGVDALEAPALPRALAPGKLALTPVLELLERVQIEGAEVLPEVLQTLEQIDVCLGEIDLASVSLDPAPSGVPPIDQAIRKAGESITDALDDL